jgi:hypothetical protein
MIASHSHYFSQAAFYDHVQYLTVNAHEGPISHHKCTTLYTFTFPVQKHCVILSHHNVHTVQKINNENVQYNNAGVGAGQKKSLTFNSTDDLKCPSGNTKSFRFGWATTAVYNVQEGDRNAHPLPGDKFVSWFFLYPLSYRFLFVPLSPCDFVRGYLTRRVAGCFRMIRLKYCLDK